VSWVTLVENDPDLTADYNSKSSYTYEINTPQTSKPTWVNNVLGVFCIKVPKRKPQTMRKEYAQPETSTAFETDIGPLSWPSPWILPVQVLMNRQDESSHASTKTAKCTIDTGNMLGNIVSREFVEEVLQCPESSIQKLTEEEERGGTGITGDLYIPEGAIYLTWYHKNSTRVFRDMRFLISPTKQCDLIIGARSIHRDNILSVPCLMGTLISDPTQRDEVETDIARLLKKMNEEWGIQEANITKLEAKLKDKPVPDSDIDKREELERGQKFAKGVQLIVKLDHRKDLTDANKKPLVNEEIEKLKEQWAVLKGTGTATGNTIRHALGDPRWDKFWAALGEKLQLLSSNPNTVSATGSQK
jgi:hypothetical protein